MIRTTTILLIALLIAACVPAGAWTINDLLRVDATVGTGTNSALCVVDFNDYPNPSYASSYAFEYRWDGVATGGDMITDLVAANIGFTATYKFSGTAIFGLGYDSRFHEGWDTGGYWSYWASTDGYNWSYPGVGFNEHTLANGGWEGWSWAPEPEWDRGAPDVAVPEPSSLMALTSLIGLATVKLLRKAGK